MVRQQKNTNSCGSCFFIATSGQDVTKVGDQRQIFAGGASYNREHEKSCFACGEKGFSRFQFETVAEDNIAVCGGVPVAIFVCVRW